MGKLLLLFILVPAVELVLLIEVGRRIGPLATLALVLITGVVGASLARWQGLGVLRQLRSELEAGRLPASSIVDGILILLAAAVLVTPGVLTDFLGFLCLIPLSRTCIKQLVWRRLERAAREGRVQFFTHGEAPPAETDRPPPPSEPVIDARFESRPPRQ